MKKHSQSGSILSTVLFVMILLMALILGVLSVAGANLHRARARVLILQAQYAAESGADMAIANLNNGNTSYAGEANDVQVLNADHYKAAFTTTVSDGSNSKEKIVIATGKVFSPSSASTPRYTRKIRVTVQRSSATNASSIMSRNIIQVGSAVKTVAAKDVFVNGYIQTDKNVNKLVFENATVGGKNTGASNCSIGGSGTLVKPATFHTSGQTKTQLKLAFNNCISPPGNTSNADFDVAVNQSSISPIQSMYIPWNQYMDNTYSNADSCSDWTTGGSTRQIPSVLGSKKTHYPNSSTNVSSSCGSSGNIDLGTNTYDITDNVHVRANFCSTSACKPTFDNTSGSIKYVFVEGTINFNALNTVSGSSPIVFITYGPDPASKASVCPLGGSIYLGQQGSTTTYAPQVYLLAMNGLCLDGTKFQKSGMPSTTDGLPTPAIGGLGGKNIFVSTNSGSPWDLGLDPTFPTSQIPVDLAWKQTGYERL